ncbi:Leucine aminopeptidase 1 [Quaeritorhiza haematococci]|nr:Leucine aminopeptidase 1 [Quaeritorhiza haematococci]
MHLWKAYSAAALAALLFLSPEAVNALYLKVPGGRTLQIPLSATELQQAQELQELRLVSLSPTEARWMTEEEKLELIRAGKHFIDITDEDPAVFASSITPQRFEAPKELHQDIVRPLTRSVSTSRMKDFLTTFSGFRTRYYKSSSGAESSKWLLNEVQDIVNQYASSEVQVTVKPFEHPWGQSSIIARIEAAGPAGSKKGGDKDSIVIVGAHQDSVNQWNPYFGRSPGADDDGSGTTTIIEAFRIILANNIVPTRPLEFHWYSAEEGGLLGSQRVVAKYKQDGVKVAGMFQVDMTGYTPANKKEVIGISTDFVDPELTGFLRKLTDEYCAIPWIDTKCGYGCSDHASWNRAGYPSAFTFEAAFNDHDPYIHSANDDISHISFDHMAEFTKLVVSYAVELVL